MAVLLLFRSETLKQEIRDSILFRTAWVGIRVYCRKVVSEGMDKSLENLILFRRILRILHNSEEWDEAVRTTLMNVFLCDHSLSEYAYRSKPYSKRF